MVVNVFVDWTGDITSNIPVELAVIPRSSPMMGEKDEDPGLLK